MTRTAAEILDEALQLPPDQQEWLANNLLGDSNAISDEELALWKQQVGEPEPGYEEWFRAGIQEALADTSPDTPHEEVVREVEEQLRNLREAQRLKASA